MTKEGRAKKKPNTRGAANNRGDSRCVSNENHAAANGRGRVAGAGLQVAGPSDAQTEGAGLRVERR